LLFSYRYLSIVLKPKFIILDQPLVALSASYVLIEWITLHEAWAMKTSSISSYVCLFIFYRCRFYLFWILLLPSKFFVQQNPLPKSFCGFYSLFFVHWLVRETIITNVCSDLFRSRSNHLLTLWSSSIYRHLKINLATQYIVSIWTFVDFIEHFAVVFLS
jgi:hypothetical protein